MVDDSRGKAVEVAHRLAQIKQHRQQFRQTFPQRQQSKLCKKHQQVAAGTVLVAKPRRVRSQVGVLSWHDSRMVAVLHYLVDESRFVFQ